MAGKFSGGERAWMRCCRQSESLRAEERIYVVISRLITITQNVATIFNIQMRIMTEIDRSCGVWEYACPQQGLHRHVKTKTMMQFGIWERRRRGKVAEASWFWRSCELRKARFSQFQSLPKSFVSEACFIVPWTVIWGTWLFWYLLCSKSAGGNKTSRTDWSEKSAVLTLLTKCWLQIADHARDEWFIRASCFDGFVRRLGIFMSFAFDWTPSHLCLWNWFVNPNQAQSMTTIIHFLGKCKEWHERECEAFCFQRKLNRLLWC